MVDCLIAFGSNLGDSRVVYQNVEDWLQQSTDTDLIACSELTRTIPIGGPDQQNPYLNGVIRIQTALGARELHRLLMDLEQTLGRIDRERWGARIVDLDLLLYGNQCVHEKDLTIPHPRMSFRRFVLEPASEIAAEMIHPDSGLSMGELLERINQKTNQLLWLTANPAQSRAILLECQDDLSDWSWDIVDAVSYQESSLPKLVVQDLEGPFLLRAPTLLMAGYTDQQKRIELRAAIKAVARF